MKLFIISQEVNNTYDTYDSAVVAANSNKEARQILPGPDCHPDNWTPFLKDVKCKYIGEAKKGIKKGVILASFNAG